MLILGISAWYHDSSVCLIKNGEIVNAVQEERFSRVKHDSRFPVQALHYCIDSADIKPDEIDFVVYYEKPFLKFERLLETYLSFAPKGFKSFKESMPLWIKQKLFLKLNLQKELDKCLGSNVLADKILFSEHHLSHAASAFYPSPFKKAAILTLDAVGEWTTTSLAIGEGNEIEIIKEIKFPHSIGLLYSAFTAFLGFKVNSGEYKVMGLAPYGEPKYANLIKENLIELKSDGSFKLNLSFFDYCTGLRMTNRKFNELFQGCERSPEGPILQVHMDIAASIQKVTEEVVLKLARFAAEVTQMDSLCLAGGVALNCVANSKVLEKKIFKDVWIQPAAGDAGGSLGAALAVHHMHLGNKRNNFKDSMSGALLGPEFNEGEIEEQLKSLGCIYKKHSYEDVYALTSRFLVEGKAVGWMQGKMEFGPRALGARSILADPRSEDMQRKLNLKIKYRESFRPFAPSVLVEHTKEWFNLDSDSPYMLLTAGVSEDKRNSINSDLKGFDLLDLNRSKIPAVTHIDFSSRVQTVRKDVNPGFHKLLKSFYDQTGCPVLVNTSFNVRGEPIVCNPIDAFKCFMGTELDVLVIEDFILLKEDQDPSLIEDYSVKYELD